MNGDIDADDLRAQFYARLAPQVATFLRGAAAAAAAQGTPLHLVGGALRDLLLGYPLLDLDLVMEGDATDFVGGLPLAAGLRVQRAPGFRNAKVDLPGAGGATQHLDFVTARREMYPKPGQLPRVWPGTLQQDLARRDFTINALALPLDPPAALLDQFAGRADLRAGVIRALHDRLFKDDPTRIFRAARYEQRFGFNIERHSLNLLRNALGKGMLDLLTPDRVRHELERTLAEPNVVAQLRRLGELDVLAAIDAALVCDDRATQEFGQVLASDLPVEGRTRRLLALLLYHMPAEARERAAKRLGLDRETVRIMESLGRLNEGRDLLDGTARASDVDRLLAKLDPAALALAALAWQNTKAGETLAGRMSAGPAEPTLNGADLIALGLTPGPAFRDLLAAKRAAVLDGEVSGRDEEIAFVRRWMATHEP